MAIFRGAGGSGDATTDSTTQALAAINAAVEAEASKTAAADSASAAATSATSASNSASTATTQAELATTNGAAQVALATTQAGNAATSATNSATSASTATTQAGIATTKASEAATSATASASSASTASTQATNAASSASTATTQAGIATTQASNASTSASAAATSAADAATIYDNFDDRYLGQKSSNPTVDNDGNTLITGALYFNTTVPEMRVWSGTAWNFIGASGSAGVNSFNTRFGDVTLSSTDVTTALTYTPLAPSAIGTTVQAYDADLTAFAAKTAPTGAVVGTTDTQTLTNKALNGTLGATTPSTAVVTSLTDSGLTSGRVTFASTGGLLADSANLFWDNTNTSLGVGTAIPNSYGKLVVDTVGGNQVVFGDLATPANETILYLRSTLATIASAAGGALRFTTGSGGTERMRIDSTGRIVSGGDIYLGGAGVYTASEAAIIYNGNGDLTLSADPNNISASSNLRFNVDNTERMRIDSAGNLGLGVTPSAWGANVKALQIGNASAAINGSGGATEMSANLYYNGTNYIYVSSFAAVLYQQNVGAGAHRWYTAPAGTAGATATLTQAMTLNASGNLGLGVTPSAWGSGYVSQQIGSGIALTSNSATSANILNNAYYNGSNWIYQSTNAASRYSFSSGMHAWYNAPSGTAGTAITFTTAMTLDASGNLGIGTTATEVPLIVNGVNGVSIASFGVTGRRYGIRNDGNLNFVNYTTDPNTVTTGMTLTSGGDLGVGTTDPTGGYAWNSAARVIGVSGDGTASISSAGVLNLDNNRATPSSTDQFGVVGFTSSTSVAGHTLKAYIVGAADGAGGGAGGFGGKIQFVTKGDNSGAAAQERMRITAAGEVLIGTTTTTSGGASLQVSDGITFPATTVVSTNPNTLDVYEEGSFTPTISGSTTAGTGTYGSRAGVYTQIGNILYFYAYVTWTAHTGTGNLLLTALPFTSSASANLAPVVNIIGSSLSNMANQLYASVVGNTTRVEIRTMVSAAGTSAVLMDTSATIVVSGFYYVA